MEFSINFSLKKKKPNPELTERDKAWIAMGRGIGMNTPGEFWNAAFPDLNPNNETKVTKENALTLSAVYQAINISANSLNLPINVKKKTDDSKILPVGKEDRYEYQCHKLLRISPNKMNTPSEWITLMETSRLMYGQAFSYIVRNGTGMPTALKWLHPDQVEITPDNIQNYYQVYDLLTQKLIYKNVPAWDMVHVKSLNGVSVIDYATNSLGLGMATQKTSKKFYEDGMTNKVVLSYPGALKEQGKKNLSESFTDQMKKNSTIVLEEGLKPYMLTIPPQQAELLLMSEFSVTDVARWFNLPEHMLNNLKTSTNNNIEFQGASFWVNNVRPRARIYEQEFNWKLLGNSELFFTDIDMNALLRSDLKTRYESYSLAIQNRILNPNEARRLENLNPYEGGDIYENPNITPGKANGSDTNNE